MTPRSMPGPTAVGSWRALQAVVATIAAALLVAACGGSDAASDIPPGPTLPPDVDVILEKSAQSMGEVTSVRFDLRREGADVFIDQFESIGIDRVVGDFSVPQSAQAVLDVEVNGSLNTQLAAIALGDEIWLSNPITGDFETLPEGYDIDPSAFFDPTDGWRPLMSGLTDTSLVGRVDRDGDRYHVRGTATQDLMRTITAGLVRDQDVTIDFWLDPVLGLVRMAEFTTDIGDGPIDWTLELSRYGEDVEIVPPDELTP